MSDADFDAEQWIARQLDRANAHRERLRRAGWSPTNTVVNVEGIHCAPGSYDAPAPTFTIPAHVIDGFMAASWEVIVNDEIESAIAAGHIRI